MTRVLKVYRAVRFSPNSVGRDRAIIDAVGALLEKEGYYVSSVNEENLTADDDAEVILTMARSPEALAVLKAKELEGRRVINRPDGIRACRRSTVDTLMRAYGLPAAPQEGDDGYWLKRGDEAAQCRDDVTYARNAAERDAALARFRERGVEDVVTTAHVKGDLVKFYGVSGTGFFMTFYPDDDGYSKFGDEKVNGRPRRYRFDADKMKSDAERLAALTGVDVYGGDCIVRDDGSYAIIDFNDWPSFSRCKDTAAEAITFKVKSDESTSRQ